MVELGDLREGIELPAISGGNSANLSWALRTMPVGRVNDLRLGEALLLGCEPPTRQPIDGLHTGAVTLIAEEIEAKEKPTLPWGDIAQSAFGYTPPPKNRGGISSEPAAITTSRIWGRNICPSAQRWPLRSTTARRSGP